MEKYYSKPLVSIGVPVKNGAVYLKRALNSLLNQEYENIELIISENDSNDNSLDICKEFANSDERIRLIHQEKTLDVINNFRATLNQAQGKYFMWAAADDCWDSKFISTLIQELEKFPKVGVAMSAIQLMNEQGVFLDKIRFNEHSPNQASFYQMVKNMTCPEKYNLFCYGLFRAEKLKNTMKVCSDVAGWDRIFMCQYALAFPFRYVDLPLYQRTIHDLPYEVRWADEKFSKIKKMRLRSIFIVQKGLIYTILASKVIPSYRKILYGALLWWRYSIMLIMNEGSYYFSREFKNRFKKIARWLISS